MPKEFTADISISDNANKKYRQCNSWYCRESMFYALKNNSEIAYPTHLNFAISCTSSNLPEFFKPVFDEISQIYSIPYTLMGNKVDFSWLDEISVSFEGGIRTVPMAWWMIAALRTLSVYHGSVSTVEDVLKLPAKLCGTWVWDSDYDRELVLNAWLARRGQENGQLMYGSWQGPASVMQSS